MPKCPYLHDDCPKAPSPIVMSFERLENDHIVCAENNQRAHCRLKGKSAQSHTVINRTAVDLVSSTKFQRVQITDTLSRSLHTRAVARRAPDEERSLTLSYPYQFLQGYYRELTDMNICVVRGLQCRKSLQRGLKTAEKISESPLPHFQDIAVKRSLIRTNVSLLFHIPTMLPAYIWVKGSAGSTAEQQHLHYPCSRAVTNPHRHHPGPISPYLLFWSFHHQMDLFSFLLDKRLDCQILIGNIKSFSNGLSVGQNVQK